MSPRKLISFAVVMAYGGPGSNFLEVAAAAVTPSTAKPAPATATAPVATAPAATAPPATAPVATAPTATAPVATAPPATAPAEKPPAKASAPTPSSSSTATAPAQSIQQKAPANAAEIPEMKAATIVGDGPKPHLKNDGQMSTSDIVRIILERVGLVLNILFNLAPISSIERVKADKTVGELSPLPFTSMVAGGALWLVYGAAIGEGIIVASQVCALGFGSYYCYVYGQFARDGEKRSLFVQQMQVAGLLFVFGMLMFGMAGREALGSMAAAMSIVVIAAPATVFYTVITTKSLAPLGSIEMALASWFSCVVWFILGAVYIRRIQVWAPNAFGILVATTTLILFGTIGKKKLKKKWTKWATQRKTSPGRRFSSVLDSSMIDEEDIFMQKWSNHRKNTNIRPVADDASTAPTETFNSDGFTSGEPHKRLSYRSQKRKLLMDGAGGELDEFRDEDDDDEEDIIGKARFSVDSMESGVSELSLGTVVHSKV